MEWSLTVYLLQGQRIRSDPNHTGRDRPIYRPFVVQRGFNCQESRDTSLLFVPEEAQPLLKVFLWAIPILGFIGTVLGGIWADQSWGRFWGWDPKENGALMIVLWSALLLHARWGSLVSRRGFMVLAVFGNVITALSWFGVNMLGIGLHSYGFMDKAFPWLAAFVASQAIVLLFGMLPARFWASYR